MRECKLCNPDEHFRVGEIDRVLYRDDDFYVAIPRDPAMKDHLLVISKEHVEDITQIKKKHWRMLSKMIIVSAVISQKLKELDSTIKKVYLLCEGETPHLHFHLKPRREGEETGDLFLFDKELEESRWALDSDNEKEAQRIALEKGIEKVTKGTAIVEKHKTLIRMSKWTRSSSEAKKFYEETIKRLKNIINELGKLV